VRRFLIAAPVLVVAAAVLWAAEDTKKAADTRKALKTKVSFNWKETPFGDVVEEIKTEVKGLRFHVDNKGGVNNNKPITYTCKDKPLQEVLTDVLGKYGWGYYVNSKKDAYDGDIYVKVGDERGYLKGEEPADKTGGEDKPKAEDKPKDKSKEKPKADDKPKEDKPKAEDDPDKAEKDAARKLKLAKQLIEDGKNDGAKEYLEEILKKYKDTKAATEAKELLDKLNK
jgi:FimV-like protein